MDCCKSDPDPPNQKPPNKKINGVNNQNQKKIEDKMQIPYKNLFHQLYSCLHSNNRNLTDLSVNTSNLMALRQDAETTFLFACFTKQLENNLYREEFKNVQVDKLINELMSPYRISYFLMQEKRYLVCNMQNLLEILEEKFLNKRQSNKKNYQQYLNLLKTKFYQLGQRFQKIMIVVKNFDLNQQKLQESRQFDQQIQRESLVEKVQNQEAAKLGIIIIGLEKQVQHLKQKISEKQVQQTRMIQQISTLKNKNQSYQTCIHNKEQQINQLKTQSKNKCIEFQTSKKQIIVSLTTQNQRFQNSISQISQLKKQMEIQIALQSQSLTNLQRQILAEKQRNTKLVQENQALCEKLIIIQNQKSRLESLNIQKTELIKRQGESTKIIHQKSQHQLIQMAKQRDQMKTILSELIQELKFAKLFAGDILQNQKKEKNFLVASIEKHMNKKIEKAKILYDTKKNYNVNYHERIDGKQNLVIVIQTKNAIVAAYYSGKYAEGTYMTQEGLILSLNNQKYYRLNNFANNPKKSKNDTKPIYGMIYDRFFLIFGNAELRVKPGEKDRKVFSNFGINNAYFNSEGDNVSRLFGEGKTNEVEFIDYEIYQVVLSSEEEKQQTNKTQKTMLGSHSNEKIQQGLNIIEEAETNRFQIMVNNYEQDCLRKDDQILQLNRQLLLLKSTKDQLKIQNERLNSNIVQIQQQLQNFKSQILQLNQILRSKQDQMFYMKKKIQEYVRLSADAEQQYIRISQQLQKEKLMNSQYSIKNSLQSIRIVSLESQIKEIKQSHIVEKQTLSYEILRRQNQVKSQENSMNDSLSRINLGEHSVIKDKLQQAQTKCDSYKIQKQTQNKQIESLKMELQHHKTITQQRCQEMEQLMRMKCSIQEQRDELFRKTQQNSKEIEHLNYNVASLQEQIQRLKLLEQTLTALRRNNQDLQQRLNHQLQKSSKMRTQSFVQLISHFYGEILEKRKVQKKFLIESIQKHMKSTIQKTKLLFESNKDSKVPFHQRIDGKQNLVIVLQTQKALIAGYYSGKYASGINMTEEGLILSLTNKKYYRLNNLTNYPKKNKNDKRQILGMIYDTFYLIFGNSQIRVKPGQNNPKVFSNFGISNSYFNGQGDNVSMLLCEGKTNDVPIISYEIYEIIFSDIQFYHENI